jgi:hypothetical protein
MSDMTAEKATALRRPFPRESIGKLPKPYRKDSPKGNCAECGGYHGLPAVHLDYVGHAATTDRLLTVDPHWTWEPMGVDQYGLPAPDAQGNLWIKLTVCGVTRIGVGDGASMKERIGDAIRNAAMRFGVALDLWAKEDLVEFAQAVNQQPESAHAPTPPPPPEDDRPLPDADEKPMQPKTRANLFALFGQKGPTERDAQLAGINAICGTAYTSRSHLTDAHAQQVIAALRKRPDLTPAEVPA